MRCVPRSKMPQRAVMRPSWSGLPGARGRLHLVAEVPGVVHADDGLDLHVDVGEELLDRGLLHIELHLIGHGEPLAAAAALGNRAVDVRPLGYEVTIFSFIVGIC